MKNHGIILTLAAAMALPAAAQQTPQANNVQPAQTTNAQASTSSTQTASDSSRQPLELQSHEGFWGHLNPFARKKYVRRQLAPVVGRVNELDELTAKNSRDIKDVDARATEGIRLASLKATEADNHAIEAGNKANLAHQTATQATARLQTVEKVVGSIDQYQPMSQTEIRFRPGQQVLSKKAKAALDELATPLKDQKGYVVEIQGFSSGRGQAAIASSRSMAEAVTRYLVVNHDVPVYKIYTVGMGNAPLKSEDGKSRRIQGGRVEISLMKNGVADLEQTASAPSQQAVGAGSQSAMPQSDNPSVNAAPVSSSRSTMNSSTTTTVAPQQPQSVQPAPVQQQPAPQTTPKF